MLANIPAFALKYQMTGKSAIEWVMERYAIAMYKDSGIENDPMIGRLRLGIGGIFRICCCRLFG